MLWRSFRVMLSKLKRLIAARQRQQDGERKKLFLTKSNSDGHFSFDIGYNFHKVLTMDSIGPRKTRDYELKGRGFRPRQEPRTDLFIPGGTHRADLAKRFGKRTDVHIMHEGKNTGTIISRQVSKTGRVRYDGESYYICHDSKGRVCIHPKFKSGGAQ
jgi:hypothetical protein